jgi:hypothetical protein
MDHHTNLLDVGITNFSHAIRAIEEYLMRHSLITTADETLGIKDCVAGVHSSLIFCSITD